MQDDLLTAPMEAWVVQVTTIEFQDSAPGTTLTASWKLQSATAPTGAVHLKAVTLAPKPN